ncbi:MAG: TPR end-of-group domain-containing protein [Bacteroidia bacterium]
MKRITFLALLMGFLPFLAYCQKTITTYYDFEKKHVHEVYGTDNYGTKNGPYTEYSEYGGILIQGTYKNGTQVGKWVTNDEKGKIYLEETRDNEGKYNGQVNRYINGIKYAQENYKHGSRIGHWKTWFYSTDYNGTVYQKPDGTTQLQYDEYYKSCEPRYVAGVGLLDWGLDSVRKEYSKQGVLLSTEYYKLGVKEGKATYYDEDGSGMIMEEEIMRNDSIYGTSKIYFNDKGDQTFKKSDATWYRINDYGNKNYKLFKGTDYYMSGEKMADETFSNNGYIGKYVEYFKNGTIKLKGQYNKDGKRDSVWNYYSVSGKDSAFRKYINGELDSPERQKQQQDEQVTKLEINGENCVINHQYPKAEDYFLKVLVLDSTYKNAYYNLACIYSLQRITDKALIYLEKAIQHGEYYNAIIHDADLANIKDTPKFKDLMNHYFGK